VAVHTASCSAAVAARSSHRRLYDLQGAVEKLPSLVSTSESNSEPNTVNLRRTGTDDGLVAVLPLRPDTQTNTVDVGSDAISDAVPDAVTYCIRGHHSASSSDNQSVETTGPVNPQPLETQQPGTNSHQVAESCLSGQSRDRTGDLAIFSRLTTRRKLMQHKVFTSSAVVECRAGCSDHTNEGGIVDTDLSALVAAWPTLPEHVRATIRTLVDCHQRTE
jgi:hypothetical protein